MITRIGVAAAMAIAASAVVLGGQASAQNGCSSNAPHWNWVCVPAGSNVTLSYCLKNKDEWGKPGECVARNDGNGRYDLWISNY
ncbi:hypothetical protein [Nocardia brasiliensis]|uniref:hypothetical protein n=1 Tax=Nocardia brasiliensis TaxID=37326 RepID=UPI00245583EB|nr:hypothetical protein [Nocardia brasiliensis]